MITITEALAEIKTIGKRLAKKREFVNGYLARTERIKDPLAADGGSVETLRRERQSIADLEDRIVELRAAIAKANATTVVAINGSKRSIADWLTWRREVAPGRQQFLKDMQNRIASFRQKVQQEGRAVVSAVANIGTEAKPDDLLVNVSESELAAEIETLEMMLGDLDGKLSLTNATTMV